MNKKTLNFIIEAIENVPGWIWTIKDCFGEEAMKYAEEYVSERDEAIEKSEKYYYREVMPKVRKEIEEFKKENKEFAKECQERRAKELQEDFKKKYRKLENSLETCGDIKKKKELLQEVEKLESRLNSEITDEMIQRAREFPFEDLIETNKFMAKCPFHDDKKPSFYTKNNYGFCFSCGWKGDTIKFIMEKENINFVDAVKKLQI